MDVSFKNPQLITINQSGLVYTKLDTMRPKFTLRNIFMLHTNGHLIIISAPSGAGKTSLVKALVETMDNLCVSISHTTRPPRPGEQEGVNYHFVDDATFAKLCDENAFLEHATVFNHHYGTSRHWLEEQLNLGKDVILEIDWQGAQQVRSQVDDNIGVFILPPSREILLKRLCGRGQDSQEVINDRMKKATAEMDHYEEYDYVVVNDDFALALKQLQTIITSARLRLSRQQQRYAKVIEALLQHEG
jgi:guanylate kinase